MAEALTHNLKLIGRYALLRELRRERYTAAYLARDPVLNREVVLKAVQLRPAPGQDPAGHERIDQAFMRQAQAAGRLHHPHMVTVFDAGRLHNVGYLVLEKVEGKLLGEALAEGWQPAPLAAADIVARVADAVEYAHARGIPHGHLGASRIYLQGADRVPRVMGFGGWIDTGITGDFELAATASMLPYYESELGADARRRDLRALGALLFLLLTGTRADVKALCARRGADSPIVELRPLVPLALAEIAETALELRQLPPHASAAKLRNALTTWIWGNAEARTLPNAVTIAGSPARYEVTLARPPASIARTETPAIAVAPVSPAATPPARSPAPGRAVVLGSALAALTVVAAVVVGWPDRREEGPAQPAVVTRTPAASAPIAAASHPPARTSLPTPAQTSAQTTHFGPSTAPPGNAAPQGSPTPPGQAAQPAVRFQ